MFILRLPLAVFSFSEKKSSVALALKVIIISHYSCLTTYFFKKTQISRLPHSASEQVAIKYILNERDAFACFDEKILVISQ